ncbi:MAG: nucleotide exchange factor GrpE [Firmicutes bacterium]|nr:nucleotide exchange factor GrpE [Bacillota bacterium]
MKKNKDKNEGLVKEVKGGEEIEGVAGDVADEFDDINGSFEGASVSSASSVPPVTHDPPEFDDEEIITILCDERDKERENKAANRDVAIYKKRADDMTAAAQRLQAEFDNYRRRTTEEKRGAREDGAAEVIEKLLPVLDSFSQAVKIIKDKSVLEGVGLIYERLGVALDGFGLLKIDALGHELDPHLMHAVMTRKEKGKSGMVVEVVLDGYLLKGKVLRPAMVVVGE